MKSKTQNRFAAVFLALAMLLTSVSFSMFASVARAEEPAGGTSADGVYVLNASDLTNVPNKPNGVYTDGQDPITAGTKNYFKIHVDSNTRFDASSQSWEDGFAGTQRINFNGGIDTTSFSNSVEFTTSNSATVTVWWRSGDVDRYVALFDQSGKEVAKTDPATDKNKTSLKNEFKITGAGKYYIGNVAKSNYIFKVEVKEDVPKTYTLNASDLTNVPNKPNGVYTDGQDPVAAGTDNFFKIHVDSNTRFDASSQSWEDGFAGTQRINFNSGIDTSTFANSVEFTAASAGKVTVWWRSGDVDRYVALFDQSGKEIAKTDPATDKNKTSLKNEFAIPAAGKYFIGNVAKSNYLFKIEVTSGGGSVVRGDWADVAAPVITSVEQTAGKDEIVVSVTGDVSNNGGDVVKVTMTDKDGNETIGRSSAEKTAHTVTFKDVPASGTYTFKAALSRDGEEDKVATETKTVDFVLTLKAPILSSVTSKGNGKIGIVWGAVAEATGYQILRDGSPVGTATETNFTNEGLTIGTKYSYTVKAVRGEEVGPESAAMATTATQEEQQVWSFVRFGTSTDDKNNGFEGAANDGKVTVFSEGGKGKVQPGSNDGLAFYYTALPTGKNFTFRAKAHLENWVVNNGQEGFGLLAMDSVPDPSNGSAAFWTNKYMAVVSKMEYYWDSEFNELTDDITLGTKYTMNLGVGVNAKQGINAETLEKIKANDSETIKAVCGSQYTLETSAVGRDTGTYNLVDCGEQTSKGTNIAKLTDFILEIQKNNTGYFITYYDEAGNVIGQKKFYDTDALSVMDKDNVYVGFFAARSMRASFSDISIKMTDPANDPPAEERPATTVRPNLSFKSASVANSTDYELRLFPNTDGKADISVNGKVVSSGVELKGKDRKDIMIKLTDGRVNKVSVSFTATGASEPVVKELNVRLDNRYASLKTIYVSPEGTSKGNGSPEKPLDIQTAVNVARPGQTIAVIAGTYLMSAPVTIERGMDGTAENPIRMIAVANPTARAAEERAIFDFQKQKGGFALGGDYWYIRGIDIANAGDSSAGIRIYGHNNTLDQVNAYGNGKTGISISTKESATDKKDIDWPSNNLILNCTSHNNADVGYEDADGFEAKLTCGEGNVFDGCVAYNNADDGWDLYARLSSGPIGAVTIQNCIAYGNGYLEDGTNAGNGNGFKLGGDGIGVKHKIINSIAFNNKADGITSNSNPNVIVENCTSYNNEKSNLNLYGKGENTDFEVKGFISFKDSNIKSGLDVADQFKAAGTQDAAKYQSEFNYFWNGTESANSKGAKVAADIFQSLKFAGSVARNDNGTIKLDGFLELSDKAPKGTGAVLSLTASKDIGEIKPDEKYPEISDNLPTGVSIPFAGATVAILGAAVAIIMSKRKRG